MRLYHGSNTGINSINLAMCRPYKDFGIGFYLTDIREQAERMAVRVAKIYGGSPVLNVFDIQDDFRELPGIKIKDFGRLSKKFLVDFEGMCKETGEISTVLRLMWETNNNLMELLSDKYTFANGIKENRKK